MELSDQLKVAAQSLQPASSLAPPQTDHGLQVKAYGDLILPGRSGCGYAEWTPNLAGMDEQVDMGIFAGGLDGLIRCTLDDDERIAGPQRCGPVLESPGAGSRGLRT